ncbi:bifunctional phosphoribosylaminoimidazolecarboxamide formyltransferase/IMP cyclohydrolase [Catalinimonas sp. 4WD22]|uniref:bifunctional phosphoribosylaminoimidazolecarboxamide formyltransferase/IMP cyclohydrolase n=1 Tax=Catalinimonas locisalis TaxID=3133978 RepID=UPI00310171BA
MMSKKINAALISVFYKENLAPIVKLLDEYGVKLYSTGGTQKFIEEQGAAVTAVEDLTGYPSILGGRVKTLHPKVFGGILSRRDDEGDVKQVQEYEIPPIDLVIVDLYPFQETVTSGASEAEIIEKIDIGGIALIRAAAKNFKDVLIVSSRQQYGALEQLLKEKEGKTDLDDRRQFAMQAFSQSSRYDTAIFQYFSGATNSEASAAANFDKAKLPVKSLRYGENPHQEAAFYGQLEDMLEQLNGKELSFNNLVDIDAAVDLIEEFKDETAFAILKHTNACGCATGASVKEAYQKAFAADTVSAFGGVLITNAEVDKAAAEEMNSLFFEVLIAPSFSDEALELLSKKKKRVLLKKKSDKSSKKQFKTLLNGVIEQDRDLKTDSLEDLKVVTKRATTDEENEALLFASKICKHTKSNTIVLANKGQLLASGVGQTSRVDALKQAIEKAKHFGFELNGAAMASDAFFPFPDCVEIANQEGISAVIQPGGSIKDQDSIDYCDAHDMAMVFTGFRHFKH